MAYQCDICGKGKLYGHNVPFSQKKTNKVWKPNLQRQFIEIGGTRMQIKACTQCLRTLKKYSKPDPVVAAVAEKAKAEPKAEAKSAKKTPAKKPAAKKTPAAAK
ncbi:MAG TPA: 50S ribosomal protein L28 [Candidatus Nanoarchaeia archaeon]|nr:50S ribosomal protein L28 [Candidatus Nanoarchaeia archaeon]